MTKLLVTGRTSFIGNNFVEQILRDTDWEIYSIERLPVRLDRPEINQFFHDLRAEVPTSIIDKVQNADYLVHFAADVSGIRSLADPELTITTNVLGTFNTLELARKLNLKKFIQVSTGEVVGAMPVGSAAEDAPLRPSNPYAASKAAAEALVNAYNVSYGLPTIIVRSMNVFGPKQQLTRFVPMVIKNILEDRTVAVHVDQHQKYGSRNWLHVDSLSATLQYLLDFEKSGGIYHVVGPELDNYEVVRILAGALDRHVTLAAVVPGPSHDHRYALKDTKLGLKFTGLEVALEETAKWYQNHREWLR